MVGTEFIPEMIVALSGKEQKKTGNQNVVGRHGDQCEGLLRSSIDGRRYAYYLCDRCGALIYPLQRRRSSVPDSRRRGSGILGPEDVKRLVVALALKKKKK